MGDTTVVLGKVGDDTPEGRAERPHVKLMDMGDGTHALATFDPQASDAETQRTAIINNQNTIIANQTTIIQLLTTTNTLLTNGIGVNVLGNDGGLL